MKRFHWLAASLAAASFAGPVWSAEVPKHTCEKPVYPGLAAIDSDEKRQALEQTLKKYMECISAYAEERKRESEAHFAARQAAVQEHNAAMQKFREDQAAAVKQREEEEKARRKK